MSPVRSDDGAKAPGGTTGSDPLAQAGAEPFQGSLTTPPDRMALVILQHVTESCFAALNEKNRMCDANSGLINLGGGVVVDTQADLAHARRMIELFGKVWPGMPKRVVNTHEDGDHVWGNQLFEGAEIIAHRTVAERMSRVADPREVQKLLDAAEGPLSRRMLGAVHPGALALAGQLRQDYDLRGIELVLPTTLFDERHVMELDGTEVHVIYMGPCHQAGDTIVHVPGERVVFAGDVIFRRCTPTGWTGTHEKWLTALDFIISLDPEVIVPGHGPVCGIEAAMEMKAYLEYVRAESRRCYEQGLSSLETSTRIDLGPYGAWRAPARLYLNVERAYREFRNEPEDAPWDMAETFDAIYRVAKARGIEVEF
jgi:glyoxylase-like metal-dependent hydrolase (beta-lactamase superfamily II)